MGAFPSFWPRPSSSVSHGTDHLLVVNVAPSAVVFVALALSPGSLLFPFSDSGFASFSAAASYSFLFLGLFFACLGLSSFFSSSSYPPPLLFLLILLLFLSPLAPLSLLQLTFLLFPLPLCSLLPRLLRSLPPFCSSFLAGHAASLVVWSSSSLDFASCQASVLGLSHDYQFLAHWYFQSWGSDFRAYLSAFYPQLSSDASRDFTSGSSVFFSALRSVASSFSVFCSSSSAVFHCFTLFLAFSSASISSSFLRSFLLPSSLGSLSAPQGWGVSTLGSPSVVSSAPPGFLPLSAPSSLFSEPPPAVSSSSLPPAAPMLAPPSSSFSSSAPPPLSGFMAPGWGSTPAASMGPPLVPGPQPSLFRPLRFLTQLLSSASASAPLSSAASGHAGFPPQPGPSSYIPPWSDSSAAPSAPHPLSLPLHILLTVPSRLGLQIPRSPDPDAPVPPMLFDSIGAEARLMYQYLVDLLLQPAGSIMSLLEEILCPLLLDNGTSPTILKIYLVYFRDIFRL